MNDEILTISTGEVCPKEETDKKCSPNLSFESGSCIQLHILIEMAKAFNLNADNKIKLFPNLEALNPKKYKKYLLSQFNKKLSDKCTTQKCWTEQAFISNMKHMAKSELEKYTFRPDGPEGKFEWLNTININEVMEQYELKNNDFKFLGAVPMDFDDFERFGIKNLNFSQLMKEGKTKLGIVFNLDNHNQPGSHWVSMYSDLKNGMIYYFDSYGTPPEKRVRTLMRRIANFCETGLGNKNIKADYNRMRHQYENSECGVYSINFIARMLKGEKFENINSKKIPDKKINKCRNVYFGNVNHK